MPGDELIARPNLAYTLAITIDSPPEEVWPWVVQLGQGRGGWYSYDWLENSLGLDIHTADRILPEFQHLQPGDVVPTGAVDIPVLAVEPSRVLLLGGAEYATIAFVLEQHGNRRTRLIFRNRARIALLPAGWVWYALLDPGIFVMSRKMLLTIKDRVERASTNQRRRKPPWFNRWCCAAPDAAAVRSRSSSTSAAVLDARHQTPIEAFPVADGFVLALGHGPGCDWCRNVLAAHGGTIISDGTRYPVADPEVIDYAAAAPLLPPLRRLVYRRTGSHDFLRVRAAARRMPAPIQPERVAA